MSSSRLNTVGIDLASAPDYGAKRYNRVGLAALAPDLELLHLEAGPFDDIRIVAFVVKSEASIVAIDAPLSLPAGRCCTEDSCHCARFGRVRSIDRACMALKLRPFPALIPSMRGVTARGIALKSRLKADGVTTIEVFPGAIQDMLGLPRKQVDLLGLHAGLTRLGIRELDGLDPNGDKLDALTCAYTGQLFRSGVYWAIAVPGETPLIFPSRRGVPAASTRLPRGYRRRGRRQRIRRKCVCGCGRSTSANFAPGHDARVYSLLRRELRGDPVRLPQTLRNNPELLKTMRAKANAIYTPTSDEDISSQ